MNPLLDVKVEDASREPEKGIIAGRPRVLLLVMVTLFAVAGAVRMYKVQAPGILIDREYTSAIIARAFYFSDNVAVADWQREIAAIQKESLPVLEPPVTEFLASLIYRAMGGERLWVSHVLTSLFWLVGGLFLYLMTRTVISTEAAVAATGYYLFAPLGILVSRSFQPDSLMMMLFLMGLYGIVRLHQSRSWAALLLASAVTGLAILVRPLVLFALVGAMVSITLFQGRSWRSLFDPKLVLFVAISLMPALLYYGYGILIAGYLQWKVGSSFEPQLYLQSRYWHNWLYLAVNGVGQVAFFGGLLGLTTLRNTLSRGLLVGLWCGYLIFGLVFTVHIHTHNYYQAQLIPIAAISLGSLFTAYLDYLKRTERKWPSWIAAVIAISVVFYFDMHAIREQIGSATFESPQLAQEIGDRVNHSSRTVFVAWFYGMPLQYYGQFSGTRWPKADEPVQFEEPPERPRSVEERLSDFGYTPEYFIITNFTWLQEYHLDLKEYLDQHCPMLVQDDRYLIYDGNCTTQIE